MLNAKPVEIRNTDQQSLRHGFFSNNTPCDQLTRLLVVHALIVPHQNTIYPLVIFWDSFPEAVCVYATRANG
jgi:hypothetical protein